MKFGTLEYWQAYAEAMNKDEAWMKAALTTSFMYIFTDVFNADGTPKAFLLKMENGKTTASEAKAADLKSPSSETLLRTLITRVLLKVRLIHRKVLN